MYIFKFFRQQFQLQMTKNTILKQFRRAKVEKQPNCCLHYKDHCTMKYRMISFPQWLYGTLCFQYFLVRSRVSRKYVYGARKWGVIQRRGPPLELHIAHRANTKHWTCVALMVGQRRRWWYSIKTAQSPDIWFTAPKPLLVWIAFKSHTLSDPL